MSPDEGIFPPILTRSAEICTRLFYNTSITAAIERFTDEGIKLDDISFTLISVKEATV